MKIAFYAPMKPPDAPRPSGDRTIARLLLRAMAIAGHEATVASAVRSYMAAPTDRDCLKQIERQGGRGLSGTLRCATPSAWPTTFSF